MDTPMTRAEQARAEAERRYPSLGHLTQPERAAWKAGARWADANPRTITRKQLTEANEAYFSVEGLVTRLDMLTAALGALGIEVEEDGA